MPHSNADIAAALSAFGTPLAEFNLKERRVLVSLICAPVLILFGAGFIWAATSGWLAANGEWNLKILFCGAGVIAAGVAFPWCVIRQRSLRVIAFPGGIAEVYRNRVSYHGWGEIEHVFLKGPLKLARANESANASCLELPRHVLNDPRLPWDWVIKVVGRSRKSLSFGESLKNLDILFGMVQAKTLEANWTKLWESFKIGEPLYFGPLRLDPHGITCDRGMLHWEEFDTIRFPNKAIAIFSSWQKKPWFSAETEKIPNIHLLVAITQRVVGKNLVATENGA